MTQEIKQAYELAKAAYAKIGVDTDAAIEALKKVKISLHCWQGDDVNGFLFQDIGFALQKRYPMKMRTSDPEKIRFYI